MLMRLNREARGCRLGWVGSLAAVVAIGLVAAGRAEASPYYMATDIGSWSDMQRIWPGYVNSKTGTAYSFWDQTTGPKLLTELGTSPLPTVTLPLPPSDHPNPGDPTFQTLTMVPTTINDLGTIIGVAPTMPNLPGGPLQLPLEWGYAVRSVDGRYGPFIALDPEKSMSARVFLSQANQILVDAHSGTRLLDLNTGVTSSIQQLIPPQILRQYPNTLIAETMNSRGDILVHASGPSGEEAFILTPPGLAPPSTVPEPSTLLIFAAAGSLALRTARRRKTA